MGVHGKAHPFSNRIRPETSRIVLPTVALLVCLLTAVSDASDGVWSYIPPPSSSFPAAVYDSHNDRMLLFGGGDHDDELLIWERPLSGPDPWKQLIVPGGPSHRWGHSAIYDENSVRAVVFGGTSGSEVWAINLSGTPNWTELLPSGSAPPARRHHTAVFDSVGTRMVVYGGRASGVEPLHDVWALDLSGPPVWTELTPSSAGPSAHIAASILDVPRNRLVVFGGLDDIWALDLSLPTVWTEILPTGTPPPPREGPRVLFDLQGDRLLMFGGGFFGDEVFNDLWALSLSEPETWSDVTPPGDLPPPREGHSMIMDTLRRRPILYGGCGYQLELTDTWALSLGNPTGWIELPPSGPPARYDASMIYDPARLTAILFGGVSFGDVLNDTWRLDLSGGDPTWQEVETSGTPPPPRGAHTTVYDFAADRMIVFGGFFAYNVHYNDVWSLDLASFTWAEITPSGDPPPPRYGHTAIVDPGRRRMIVYGGSGASPSFPWSLSLDGNAVWTTLSPGGQTPPFRTGHSAIMDLARDRMIVFGGRGAVHLNDTWALSLAGAGSWQQLSPAGSLPAPRMEHSAVYDASRDKMILFAGGYLDIFSYHYRDAWALSLGESGVWTELQPGGDPPTYQRSQAATYDPIHDRMIVFGGDNNGAECSQLVWGTPVAVPEPDTRPLTPVLLPAHPNPMRSATRIRFTIPEGDPIAARLEILDIEGRLVRVLVNETRTAGLYEVEWNGLGDGGAEVAAGFYVYRLSIGNRVASRKLIRIR